MSAEARCYYITIKALKIGHNCLRFYIPLLTCAGLTDTKGKDLWKICVPTKQKWNAKLSNVGQIKWLSTSILDS